MQGCSHRKAPLYTPYYRGKEWAGPFQEPADRRNYLHLLIRPLSAGGAVCLQPTAELAVQAEPLDRTAQATPHVEASRGACAASKRASTRLSGNCFGYRLSATARPPGLVAGGERCPGPDSSDCSAISAVDYRDSARSAGLKVTLFLRKPAVGNRLSMQRREKPAVFQNRRLLQPPIKRANCTVSS